MGLAGAPKPINLGLIEFKIIINIINIIIVIIINKIINKISKNIVTICRYTTSGDGSRFFVYLTKRVFFLDWGKQRFYWSRHLVI